MKIDFLGRRAWGVCVRSGGVFAGGRCAAARPCYNLNTMQNFDDKSTSARLKDLHREEEERLVQNLAPQYGYEYVNLRGYTINPEAVVTIPEDKARAARIVAFELNNQTLSVAVQSPQDPATQALLEELQEQRYVLQVYMCSSSSLEHAWARYADINDIQAKQKGVFDIDADEIIAFTKAITTREDVRAEMDKIGSINNARRISETMELMFAGALGLGASDIHLEPEPDGIRMRYRLDGVLHDVTDIDRYLFERLISRLKLLSGMTLNQRQEAQDGRFTFSIGDREIEVRASIIPGAAGESMVMRLLDPTVASFSMDNLDLNPIMHKTMANELKKPNGLIITTGPTGSGKTTALYAFLRVTHKEGVKIITIENPVEYKLEGIVQTQTGDDYTFATGLRAVLRQDPDIIMVGEIRDREVAETAIHAAQTGHLVFSTLHTNSAVGGFPRLIDLGVDSRIIGSAVNVLLGQRLVRLLCPHCKESYEPPEDDKEVVTRVAKRHPEQPAIPDPFRLYRKGGCVECSHTGFKGRAGIFEAIVVDEEVEEAVIRDPREVTILEAAEPQGIPMMEEDGIVKVLNGDTSLEELERVIELPRHAGKEALAMSTVERKKVDDTFAEHIVE